MLWRGNRRTETNTRLLKHCNAELYQLIKVSINSDNVFTPFQEIPKAL